MRSNQFWDSRAVRWGSLRQGQAVHALTNTFPDSCEHPGSPGLRRVSMRRVGIVLTAGAALVLALVVPTVAGATSKSTTENAETRPRAMGSTIRSRPRGSEGRAARTAGTASMTGVVVEAIVTAGAVAATASTVTRATTVTPATTVSLATTGTRITAAASAATSTTHAARMAPAGAATAARKAAGQTVGRSRTRSAHTTRGVIATTSPPSRSRSRSRRRNRIPSRASIRTHNRPPTRGRFRRRTRACRRHPIRGRSRTDLNQQ